MQKWKMILAVLAVLGAWASAQAGERVPVEVEGDVWVMQGTEGNRRAERPRGWAANWPETDLLMEPGQSPFVRGQGALKARPVARQGYPEEGDIIWTRPRQGDLNGLSGFFSSASGGFGFRMGYDRRLSPVMRLMAGMEMMTYGPLQALAKLGSDMPPGVDRVTLVAMPVGLQRQFGVEKRVAPYVGFGVGPYFRYDHEGVNRYYGSGFGASVGIGYNRAGVNVGMPITGFTQISMTLGGYAGTGFDVRLGERKDQAVTVTGRYTLARFFDALGNPGDLSGFSLGIGFGKYF